MSLGSLLVSRDKEMIRVLRPALENLSIEVEVSRGARSGTEILSSEKFDAVIIDCDDLYGGLDVLQSLRRSPSNKNSVSFAILNGKTTTHQAFELGAQFVMQKPISQLGATRCVGAALGFMERERRRYFRYPVEMPVVVAFGRQELKLTAMNLSDGGLALRLRGKLPKERNHPRILYSTWRSRLRRRQSRNRLDRRHFQRRHPFRRTLSGLPTETRTLARGTAAIINRDSRPAYSR